MSTQFPWLTVLTLLPLVASLPIPFLPDKYGKNVRSYALGVALTEFSLLIYTFWKHYDLADPGFQLVDHYAWIPQLGRSLPSSSIRCWSLKRATRF